MPLGGGALGSEVAGVGFGAVIIVSSKIYRKKNRAPRKPVAEPSIYTTQILLFEV
jgi:hypothetical protein